MNAPDLSNLFHTGIRVADIGAAMTEIGAATGVTWSQVQHREMPVWTPATGVVTVELSFTYSSEGPVHLELLQGQRGSVWDGHDVPGVHHLGVWTNDVAAETNRLVALGWTLEAASLPPEQGFGTFTYVRSPSGILYEPVSSAARPAFERWWAGGSLR